MLASNQDLIKESLEAAKRAIQRGDLTSAKALKERAEALKSGKPLPDPANLYTALEALKADNAEREQTERLDRELRKAFKAVTLEDVDPSARMLANELHGGHYADLAYRKMQGYLAYLRGARPDETAHKCVLSPTQLLQAVREGWSASHLKAVMNVAQDTQGGVLAPEIVSEHIMGRAATLTVVRPRATVDTAGTGGSLAYAVWTGSGDIYSTALRGVWSSELQGSTSENPRLGKASLEPKLWRLKVVVSKSLLEDGGPRLSLGLHTKFAETYAVAEDAEMLVGQGSNGPAGILAQIAGTLQNKDIRVTSSGAAGAITGDAVVAMIYSLPGQYRTAPGFCITCNASTVQTLRGLKDGQGRYLFSDTDHTLLGYPLVESESMQSIATNNYPLLAGDFAGYGIGDHIGLTVQLMQDSALADSDSAAFYIRRRVGGGPVEGYRFSTLKVA